MECDEDVYVDIVDESPVENEKGIVEASEFDRWDGCGSISGADESDHFYGRYRNEGGEYGRSYKVRSVVEKRQDAENEGGGSLSSWHQKEAESGDEEEKLSGRRVKCEPGDTVRNRNYRRKNVVDRDSSGEEDEEKFTRNVKMHGPEDKDHERSYRRRKVVDDEYSDEEAEVEELFAGKLVMHGSVDKARCRNYRHRRVADDDFSDDKAKEEQFTRKVNIHGSEVKEHKKMYMHRRDVDDDHSEDERVEGKIPSKLIIHGSGDKQHKKDSKRIRVNNDGYVDDNVEFAAKRSKELDDSGSQDWHSGKILSHRQSKSRDENMSEDHVKKDRDRNRHRDRDSHERKKGRQRDKHFTHDWYDEEDKYKRGLKDIRDSTRMSSENYDEDDNLERKILGKEREYGYKKSSRSAKEEHFDRRRDMHHSAKYPNEDDDDWEMGIMEGKRDYGYTKERRNDAKNDMNNRKLRGTQNSTRYQTEHDDDDWEREGSWERGREMNDNSYEMKRMKKEKYQDFRGHGKESLIRTSLIEREKEGDVREQVGEIWENQEINRHVKGRLGSRETGYVRRDLRIQITEAKDMSRRRELTDVEKERDLMEQRSPSLDVSLQRELEERQKERDFRGRDTECMGKSEEIKRNKDKGESWKSTFSESTINKRDREPGAKICDKEKIHKVIRKKDLTERDITSMPDTHRRKSDRKIENIISHRDFGKKDSRKQDMEHLLDIAKESDSEDYHIFSREMSQETERDRKTRPKSQKTEFISREKQGREGRHNMSERDDVLRRHEKILKKKDEEKKEEHQDRGFNKRRETTRRDYVERGIRNPDKEIRERSLKLEETRNKNERDFMLGVMRERSHQKECLSKAEKSLGGSDKMTNKKILENDSEDNENRRDHITWDADMEKSQQKELLNKEKDKSRRECVKRSMEYTLEDKSGDKERDTNLAVRDVVCWEKSKQTVEGENVRESQEEEEFR